MDELDGRVIACNYTVDTNIARKGALAYVLLLNPGGGHDRLSVLARSRSGRWVEKWESVWRLASFRFKTIPPEHSLYGRLWFDAPQLRRCFTEENLECLRAAHAREIERRRAH